MSSIFPGHKPLPGFSDIPKGVQHTGSHKIPASEKAVTSKILPDINPQSTLTLPITENFKFTLIAHVPHEPGHAPSKERFSFTQESKALLEEIDLAPVRRPAVKPNMFTPPKDPAQPHHIPSIVSALTPEDEAFVAEASTLASRVKKPDEVPVFVPIKTSLAEPSIPTNQAKKPTEEPKLIPIKPPFAKQPISTRQTSQPTETPQFSAVKSPVETEYKRLTTKDLRRQEWPSVPTHRARKSTEVPQSPEGKHPVEKQDKRSTTKYVERQEGKAEADKKHDPAAMRELLAEKREPRSQRDALTREKAGLETKLHRLTDEVKEVESREEETKKAMSVNIKVADLKTENDRLKKEMEMLSLLPAPKPEQEKLSYPARTGISGKSTVDGDLLTEKAKEDDALKDEIKQRTKKERDLKESTEAEVLESKAKLRKAEDNLNQKKKDDEYISKRMDRDIKTISDLSDELTKPQISKNRMEIEFKAQTVRLNKAKTRKAEANSKEKMSEAETKLAKERAEQLTKDLEASRDEIKGAKAQNDKLAKDLERSNSRKLTAPASSDLKLRKIETSEASQTSPNQVEEIHKRDKEKIRDLTADNEELREKLELANVLQSLKSMEITSLKAAIPTQPERTSNEEDKQKIRDLTADNEELQKKLELANVLQSLKSMEITSLKAATLTQLEGISNEEDKQKIRDLTADNEELQKKLELANVLQSLKSMEITSLKAATLTQLEGISNEEDKQKIRDLTADVEALRKELDSPAQLEKTSNEEDKQKIRDLTADVEALRKDLKLATVLQSPNSIEIQGLKTATDTTQHVETSSEEEKQKIRDLTADNETLRKELEQTKLLGHVRSIEANELGATTSPTSQSEETSSSEEDKQQTRKLTADNEVLRGEIDELRKASNEIINPLTARNKALAKNCQDLKKRIAAQTNRVGKLSASNEELGRKLKISEEVEERAIRKVHKTEELYADFDPLKTTNAQQENSIKNLRAKLAEEAMARQKSNSIAKLLEQKLAAQSDSLREVAKERAELMGKVGEQEAELAKYQDARKSVTVEAELEVTKTMMERQRVSLENADAKRAHKMKTALDSLEQNERNRRQKLTEEVEAKATMLLDAKKEIGELNRKLTASNEATEAALADAAAASTASAASAASATSAASASPKLSKSSPSSTPPKTSPGSGHPPSPPNTTTTSITSPTKTKTTAGTMPWFSLQRFPTICIQMNLSPRRLLVFLFILGLAFLAPYNHSRALGRQSAEERDMWRAANEISRREIMNWSSWDQGIAQEEARVVVTLYREGKAVPAEQGW